VQQTCDLDAGNHAHHLSPSTIAMTVVEYQTVNPSSQQCFLTSLVHQKNPTLTPLRGGKFLALRILHETEMSSGTQTNVMNDS
jgi:hypothetical protein